MNWHCASVDLRSSAGHLLLGLLGAGLAGLGLVGLDVGVAGCGRGGECVIFDAICVIV